MGKSCPPTTAAWDAAILQFELFRRLEKPDDLRRMRRLPRVLTEIAQEVYDAANALERTGKLPVKLADYTARKIVDRIAFHGFAPEVERRAVPLEFLDDLPARLRASPVALRSWAHELMENADRAERIVAKFVECVGWLRGSATGRFRSVAMFFFIRKTDAWGSTIPEIARQLVQRGVIPTSKSDDPDPQQQWEMLLKKGRERARRRVDA